MKYEVFFKFYVNPEVVEHRGFIWEKDGVIYKVERHPEVAAETGFGITACKVGDHMDRYNYLYKYLPVPDSSDKNDVITVIGNVLSRHRIRHQEEFDRRSKIKLGNASSADLRLLWLAEGRLMAYDEIITNLKFELDKNA